MATRPPPPELPRAEPSIRLGDTEHAHARQRLRVLGEAAVGADHQYAAQLVGIADAHFVYARIVGAGRLVRALHQFDLGHHLGFDRRQRHGIQVVRRPGRSIRPSAASPDHWQSAQPYGQRAGCAQARDRRCRRIRCARRKARAPRIPPRCPAWPTSPCSRRAKPRSRSGIRSRGRRSRRRPISAAER